MEESVWNGNETEEEEQLAPKEDAEKRLHAAVSRIVPDESAKKRIVEGVKTGKRNGRRLTLRIPAAVFAACLLLSLFCFARPGVIGEDVVVYAATEEQGWQKLVEGERILLKKEPYQTLEDGEEPFMTMGGVLIILIYAPFGWWCLKTMSMTGRWLSSGMTIFWNLATDLNGGWRRSGRRMRAGL